jgi:hypothetical protein
MTLFRLLLIILSIWLFVEFYYGNYNTPLYMVDDSTKEMAAISCIICFVLTLINDTKWNGR